MDSVLPSDKVAELRKVVDRLLRDGNVYGQIREALADYTTREAGLLPSSDHILSLVQEKGIVGNLIGAAAPSATQDSHRGPAFSGSAARTPLAPSACRYLHARLLGGRAFLEHLDTDPIAVSNVNGGGSGGDSLRLHMMFGGQRFASAPADCVCDPDFADSFLINLDEELARLGAGTQSMGRFSGSRDLLKLSSKIHVVILRENERNKTKRYIGENTIEWRRVLESGVANLSVEIGTGGGNMNVPVGLLEVQLELLPVQPNISDADVQQQVTSERNNATASDREFLVYAKRWWQEYQAAGSFANRHVKVFASVQSHASQTCCVTAFVTPVTAERVLDSPLTSARYVSLLTYDQDDDTITSPHGVIRDVACPSAFSFVVKGKGELQEHAHLLCSLLLGHGLDAWVALGVDESLHHRGCVVTFEGDQRGDASCVTFWDVLSGARYKMLNGASLAENMGVLSFAEWGPQAMTRVHCCYTADQFAANIQPNDDVRATSFDLFNESLWKAMNPIKLKLIQKHPAPSINPSVFHFPSTRALSIPATEQDMEGQLMEMITSYREKIGVPTVWDQGKLAHVFSQSLWAYEHQKVTNVPLDTRMFQSAIKGSIVKGQNCRAFPVNFSHCSAVRAMKHFASNVHTKDIIAAFGDDVCKKNPT